MNMIEDSNSSDGSTVEHYVYSSSDQRAQVEHYKILGGDHDWPGAWGNKDIDATILIWTFFKQCDLQGRRLIAD